MNKVQARAAINAALAELDAKEGDYSISDIAHLTDLPIGVVSEYVYWAGCRPEWAKMRNRWSTLGYWKLND